MTLMRNIGIALLSILPVVSAVSETAFKKALGQATTKVNKTAVVKLEYGAFKPVESVTKSQDGPSGGSWQLILQDFCTVPGKDGKGKIVPGVAIIKNYGNRFEYTFVTKYS